MPTETFSLRELLLPELEDELAKVRKTLDHLPEGHTEYKPHAKSMSLARLAGHLAELPNMADLILTTPGVDLRANNSGRKALLMESKPQLLAEFDAFCDKLITDVKHTSDETFHQHWTLSAGDMKIFSGTRYAAYRTFGLNHIIHHRAQLGVYIRLLDHAVPSIYGPSADESL